MTIWDQIRVAIVQRRVAFGPQAGRAFEHLAMRSRRYIESGQMDREYARLEHDAALPAPLVPTAAGGAMRAPFGSPNTGE